MKVSRVNPITGKTNTMDLDVSLNQIERWQSGELIQKVMPHLSTTEREFLITGMSPEEQEEFYNQFLDE